MNMVTRQDIQSVCDDIVREFAPLQVMLFGSYAYGAPTEYSDVDLLVVMPVAKSEARQQEIEIRERLARPFRLHVLVHSPEDLAYRLSLITTGSSKRSLKKARCFMKLPIFS